MIRQVVSLSVVVIVSWCFCATELFRLYAPPYFVNLFHTALVAILNVLDCVELFPVQLERSLVLYSWRNVKYFIETIQSRFQWFPYYFRISLLILEIYARVLESFAYYRPVIFPAMFIPEVEESEMGAPEPPPPQNSVP